MKMRLSMTCLMGAIFLLTFSACYQGRGGKCVFEGKLTGAVGGERVFLSRLEDRVNFRSCLAVVDTAFVEDDNSFRFQWPATESGWYELSSSEGWSLLPNPVYLRPGDHLSVEVVTGTKRTARDWKGAFEEFYPYYLEARDVGELSGSELYELPPDSFRRYMDDVLNTREDLLRQYKTKSDSLAPLVSHARAQLRYSYASEHFDYLKYHNYYAYDTFHHLFPEDPVFFAFLDTANLGSGFMKHIPEYQRAVNGYLDHGFQIQTRSLPDSVRWQRELTVKTQIVRNSWQGSLQDAGFNALFASPFALEDPHLFNIADSADLFFRNSTSDKLSYQKFRYVLDKFERLRPGQTVPPLGLPDASDLIFSIESLKGKVVYIDFWGTWCFPCLEELPNSLALRDSFEGEDVAFVFVALESGKESVDRWRGFVTGKRDLDYAAFLPRMKWPGIHLLAEGQFGNPEIRDFLISYAPSYMLVGRDGKIIKPRAPRPGNPETIKLIRKALAGPKCLTCPEEEKG